MKINRKSLHVCDTYDTNFILPCETYYDYGLLQHFFKGEKA